MIKIIAIGMPLIAHAAAHTALILLLIRIETT